MVQYALKMTVLLLYVNFQRLAFLFLVTVPLLSETLKES